MTPAPWIASPCPSACETHRAAALDRQKQLTKPPGSLGRLEDIAVTLAALQATDRPAADVAPIILFAGDHGITAQGVSAFPSAVTVEMLRNFAGGGAAISVMARSLGVPLTVVDAGTLSSEPIAGVIRDKSRNGTADFSISPAMRDDDVSYALDTGQRAIAALPASDLVLFGEMGIGNTTAAAAIATALLGEKAQDLVGAGTGVNAAGQARKAEVIEAAIRLHALEPRDPLGVLQHVGGLEIAALVGAMIQAGHARLPVLVDGFIVSVAALVAVQINPTLRPWLLFAHRSMEQGHAKVLQALNAKPLLELELRLGEGSGAAIALPLIRSACALHNGMATFDEAAVSDGTSHAHD